MVEITYIGIPVGVRRSRGKVWVWVALWRGPSTVINQSSVIYPSMARVAAVKGWDEGSGVAGLDEDGQSRSWTQASHEGDAQTIEPGNVKIFCSNATKASALKRGPWFPRGQRIALRTTISLILLANAVLFNVVLYVYCGTSIFFVVALAGTLIYYWIGKPWVLINVRKKGSPAFKPMSLCTPAMLAPIQSRDILQFGPFGVHVVNQLLQALTVFGGLACIIYGGSSTLPVWALVNICTGMPLLMMDVMGAGNPMLVTDLFMRSAEGLVACLKQLEVFACVHSPQGTRVDWAATYKNYDTMCKVVEEFSQSWRTFFFVIEFVCVPGFGLNLIGLLSNINDLRLAILGLMTGDPGSSELPLTFRVGSVLLNVGGCVGSASFMIGLWVIASRITDACNSPRIRGLAAISESSKLSSEDADKECERARRFVAYSEHRAPGFSCHGITISFYLGMLLAYPLITFSITFAFPVAMTFLG